MVLTSTLAIRTHRGFADVADTYCFVNVFWNTCHGRFLYCGELGINSLGDHVSPTLALVAALYAVSQSVETLIVCQRVALALAAVPLYLCARRVLRSGSEALVLALAYFVYAPHVAINLQNFKDIAISVPLLMWLFACYETRRVSWLWVALLLCCGTKENVPLVVAGFGLFVAVFRREWKLGGGVIAAALIWFFLAIGVVLPYFGGTSFDSRRMQGDFSFDGRSSLSGIVWGILSNPLGIARMALAKEYMMHMARLLGPVCFLSLAAPEALIAAAPVALQTLLMAGADTRRGLTHHHAAMVPVIVYAAVLGIRRVSDILARRGVDARRAAQWCAVAVLTCCAI